MISKIDGLPQICLEREARGKYAEKRKCVVENKGNSNKVGHRPVAVIPKRFELVVSTASVDSIGVVSDSPSPFNHDIYHPMMLVLHL